MGHRSPNNSQPKSANDTKIGLLVRPFKMIKRMRRLHQGNLLDGMLIDLMEEGPPMSSRDKVNLWQNQP